MKNRVLTTEQIEPMTPEEEKRFNDRIMRILALDDGQAVKDNLAAGFPVIYRDARCINPDELIREWPDGRKELVQAVRRNLTVLRVL
jgi:hypothetical protein